MKVEFFKHNIGDKEIEAVNNVLRSIFLTNASVTKDFETKFSKYLNVNYTVGLNSCTAALHLSLLALGIGPGDEVITTPFTFAATSHTIMHCGAKPVFVDVEKSTGNIDPSLIEEAITPRTKAIMVVHLYGNMCDMVKIRTIADKYNLNIIEDAAHCIEGERDGFKVGELGDTACFSFYATKNITCGEGGAVVCKDEELYDKFIRLRLHGINKDASSRYTKKFQQYDIDTLGWKYNISDIQSALLQNQLDQIEVYLSKRETISQIYEREFDKAGIKYITVPENTRSARHLFVILIEDRNQVLEKLQEKQIGVAVNYLPLYEMSYYKEKLKFQPSQFPVTEYLSKRCLSIPLYPKLKAEEISYIVDSIKEMVL